MRAEGAPPTLAPIPCYAFPESAALALARVAAYGEWRARPIESAPRLDRFDRGGIRQMVDMVMARGGGWTTADEATALLTAAGIRCAASRLAKTCDEAVQAATSIGYPVALKALGPALLHKTEHRAVALNLASATDVQVAFEDFTKRLGADMSVRARPGDAGHGG